MVCTHHSSLSGRPEIFLGSGTLKKKVQNMGCKKQGAKTGLLLFKKEKKQPWPYLVLNNNALMTLDFCTLILQLIFWIPTHVFKRRIDGADWLGVWLCPIQGNTDPVLPTLIFTQQEGMVLTLIWLLWHAAFFVQRIHVVKLL